ncbi:hypothetical protein NHX12_007824 [Muraenolepis orangiensis]|uniref:Uncharacterized protein n=1 Tax=Muraenolepis orangiensis TaxID=630683 RepID=A0A9Q0DU85_9TELE|nr:hypothetical protein NHX12_007824 [Muraenolepis orangiensis]
MVQRVERGDGPEGGTGRWSRGWNGERVQRVERGDGPEGGTGRGSRGWNGEMVQRVERGDGPEGGTGRWSRGWNGEMVQRVERGDGPEGGTGRWARGWNGEMVQRVERGDGPEGGTGRWARGWNGEMVQRVERGDGKNDIFGEMIQRSSKSGKSSGDVRALSYCDLHTIQRDELLEVLDMYPEFNDFFFNNLELTFNLRDEANSQDNDSDGGDQRKQRTSFTSRLSRAESHPEADEDSGRRREESYSCLKRASEDSGREDLRSLSSSGPPGDLQPGLPSSPDQHPRVRSPSSGDSPGDEWPRQRPAARRHESAEVRHQEDASPSEVTYGEVEQRLDQLQVHLTRLEAHMLSDIQNILQLLQRQTAACPPAYSTDHTPEWNRHPAPKDHVTTAHQDHVTTVHQDHVTTAHPDHVTTVHPDHVTTVHPDHVTTVHQDHVTTAHQNHVTRAYQYHLTTAHQDHVSHRSHIRTAQQQRSSLVLLPVDTSFSSSSCCSSSAMLPRPASDPGLPGP